MGEDEDGNTVFLIEQFLHIRPTDYVKFYAAFF